MFNASGFLFHQSLLKQQHCIAKETYIKTAGSWHYIFYEKNRKKIPSRLPQNSEMQNLSCCHDHWCWSSKLVIVSILLLLFRLLPGLSCVVLIFIVFIFSPQKFGKWFSFYLQLWYVKMCGPISARRDEESALWSKLVQELFLKLWWWW